MGEFPRHAGRVRREATGDSGPTRVLSIHTATRPPLGADTWIHAQIMANLDPATAAKKLQERGATIAASESNASPTFRDPDGIPVQVARSRSNG